jgi:ABC-type glutathione transport system ATPase component
MVRIDEMLEVRELSVSYQNRTRGETTRRVIENLSFDLPPDHVLGLVGESGAGKTTLALALAGLLPPNARIESGSIRFRGRELLGRTEREMCKVRGAQIGLIFQEPFAALNPVLTAGGQIAEVIRAHRKCARAECRNAVGNLLREVSLPDSGDFYHRYPHELSGGQRQRIVIAQALACRPSLVIADEPTSALDTLTQSEILNLIRELKTRHGLSLLVISHSRAMLAEFADRVMVLRQGRLMHERL